MLIGGNFSTLPSIPDFHITFNIHDFLLSSHTNLKAKNSSSVTILKW